MLIVLELQIGWTWDPDHFQTQKINGRAFIFILRNVVSYFSDH